METPQLPKWHSAERRFEALAKFKAYVLTREGAVVTAIVLVAIIALTTGMFYVVRSRSVVTREELERLRLQAEQELNAQATTLPTEEAEEKKAEMENLIFPGAVGIPEQDARIKEKELNDLLGN